MVAMSDDGMAMSSAHNPLNSTVNNSVRISVPPVGDADSALDPFLGTNLPMYPALPQSRRLSSFDPEWEDDPDYIAQRTDEAVRAMQQQVLPSADWGWISSCRRRWFGFVRRMLTEGDVLLNDNAVDQGTRWQ